MTDGEHQAQEWARTDTNAVQGDIRRLGFDGATEYNLELIADRKASGDRRWDNVTKETLLKAMKDL